MIRKNFDCTIDKSPFKAGHIILSVTQQSPDSDWTVVHLSPDEAEIVATRLQDYLKERTVK